MLLNSAFQNDATPHRTKLPYILKNNVGPNQFYTDSVSTDNNFIQLTN